MFRLRPVCGFDSSSLCGSCCPPGPYMGSLESESPAIVAERVPGHSAFQGCFQGVVFSTEQKILLPSGTG